MSNIVNSFVDYWNIITSIKCDEDEVLLFRGQYNSEWLLQSSVFRNKPKDFEKDVYHKTMLEYPEEFQKRSHLSNLVKMQHYEVPTRLLDFTRNPLNALFFACDSYKPKSEELVDGAVFVIKVKCSKILHHNSDKALMLSCIPLFSDDEQEELRQFCQKHKGRITEQHIQSYNAMHKFIHEIRGEYPTFVCEIIGEDLLRGYFVATFKDNERIKRQNGLFYIFGLGEKVLDESKEEIAKIIISKDAKEQIIKDLKLIDISHFILYDEKKIELK